MKKRIIPLCVIAPILLSSCGNNLYGKVYDRWTDTQKATISEYLGSDIELPFMYMPAMDVFGVNLDAYDQTDPNADPINVGAVLVRAPGGTAKNVEDYRDIASDEKYGLTPLESLDLTNRLIEYVVPIDNGNGVESEEGGLPFAILNTPTYQKYTLKKDLQNNHSLILVIGLAYMMLGDGQTPNYTNLNFAVVAANVDDALIPNFDEIFNDILNDAGFGDSTPLPEDSTTDITDYLDSNPDLDPEDVTEITENIPPSVFPEPEVTVDDEGYSVTNVVPEEHRDDVNDLLSDYGNDDDLVNEAKRLILDRFAEVLAASNYIRLGSLPKNDTRPNDLEVFYLTLPSGKYSVCYVRIEISNLCIVSDYRVEANLPNESDGLIPYIPA